MLSSERVEAHSLFPHWLDDGKAPATVTGIILGKDKNIHWSWEMQAAQTNSQFALRHPVRVKDILPPIVGNTIGAPADPGYMLEPPLVM